MGPIQRFTENQNTGADFIKKKMNSMMITNFFFFIFQFVYLKK